MIAGAVILCGADCFIMVNCTKRAERCDQIDQVSAWLDLGGVRTLRTTGSALLRVVGGYGKSLNQISLSPAQIIDPALTDVHRPLGVLGLPGVEGTGRFRSPAWRG